MRIFYPFDNLPKKKLNLLLRELVFIDILIKFSSLGHLHDNEDVSGGIEYLIKFDDVWVANKFEDFNLAGDLDLK